MRNVLLFSTVFLLFPVAGFAQSEESGFFGGLFGDDTTPEAEEPAAPNYEDFLYNQEKPDNLYENGFELNIRMLERYTDTTQDFTITPNNSIIYKNTFLIRTESCVTDFKNIPGNDGGFVTIENRDGDMLYKGWIFKSMPSLTSFQHPDYDILVRGCVVTK